MPKSEKNMFFSMKIKLVSVNVSISKYMETILYVLVFLGTGKAAASVGKLVIVKIIRRIFVPYG